MSCKCVCVCVGVCVCMSVRECLYVCACVQYVCLYCVCHHHKDVAMTLKTLP